MRISDWSSDVGSSDRPYAMADLLPHRPPMVLLDRVLGWDTGRLDAAVEIRTDSRSEERSVGKECVRTCRCRWSRYHEKKHRNGCDTRATTYRTLDTENELATF